MQSGSVKLFSTLLSGVAAIALLSSSASAQQVDENENILVMKLVSLIFTTRLQHWTWCAKFRLSR